MRISSDLAKLWMLVQKSAFALGYFTFIIVVVMIAFATSLLAKSKLTLIHLHHFGQKSLGEGFYAQYQYMFSDFGPWDDYRHQDSLDGDDYPVETIDYVFFASFSIIMSLLLFNLLIAIFSDVYGRVKEKELAYEYLQKNMLILDLETFISNSYYYGRMNILDRCHSTNLED